MTLYVATANPIKLRAVETVVEELGLSAAIVRVDSPPELPEQPIGDEVERGAVVRARAALPAKAAPEDLGIGIEAGLIRLSIDGRWVSAQVCALAATDGRVVVGLGPGYELPERLQAEVLGGEPLRPAFERLLGVTDPDRRGAVHHLSNGWIDRESLTREAVRMAFLSLRATPRPLRAS